MSRKNWLVLGLCIACWLVYVRHIGNGLNPEANGVRTYKEFKDKMPEPEAYVFIRRGEPSFLRIALPWKFVMLPSGHPAFVFDRNGRLIDWTRDDGDDSRFSNQWGQGLGERTDRDAAEAWLKAE
jgi:hypothetical protein